MNIGILGLGTVGGGVVNVLSKNESEIFARTGEKINVTHGAVKSISEPRICSDGDINIKSGKDINIEAADAIRMQSTTFDAEIQGAWNEQVEGNNTKTGKDITITGNTITATGDPINLN